jgi:HSP20 family protein
MTFLVKPTRVHGRNVNRLFNDMMHAQNCCWGSESGFTPRVDIRESEDDIRLTFEIPGLEKDDIKVKIDNRVLTVSGKRPVRRDEENARYLLTELHSGEFSRSFTLPDTLDTTKVEAGYRQGLLTITLAKAEAQKPKQVDIKVS